MQEEPPRKLVYLTDNIPVHETPQKPAVMGVISDLERYLGVPAEGVSVEQMWNSEPPEDAKGEKLHEFLHEVGMPDRDFIGSRSVGGREYFPVCKLSQRREVPRRESQGIWQKAFCERFCPMAVVRCLSVVSIGSF